MIRRTVISFSLFLGVLTAHSEILLGDTCGYFPSPHAEPGNSFCTNEDFYDIAALATSGGDLFWYSDASLTNLVGTGSYCTPLNIIGTTTYYVVAIEDSCISEPATVNVTIYPLPEVQIAPSSPIVIYSGGTVTLQSNHSLNNLWSNNSAEDSLVITQPGEYGLTVTDEFGCTASDTAFVEFVDTTSAHGYHPTLFIPNSFTPDGDGLNDVFLVTTHDLSFFLLRIYNRWGELIFETKEASQPWLGGDLHYNGGDVFNYWVQYGDAYNRREKTGTLHLIR